MEEDAKPFLQEIRNAKKILKAKRFWQIQGLNIVGGLYYILARVWLSLAYTFVVFIMIYGTPQTLNHSQTNYLFVITYIIGIYLWLLLNVASAVRKEKTNILYVITKTGFKIMFDYLVISALFRIFLYPNNYASNFELLTNLVFYTMLCEIFLLFIQKFSLAMIKKHFNDGEEENRWKNWTTVKTVQTTKEYGSLIPVESKDFRTEWEEDITESTTVQFLYSRVTISEDRKKGSQILITSNHPEGMSEKMTKDTNRKDGYKNRIN